jgi:hypothetical protein
MNNINFDRYCERVIETPEDRMDMWKEMNKEIEEEEQRLEEYVQHSSKSGKRAAIEQIKSAQDKRQLENVLGNDYQNPKKSTYYTNIVESANLDREFKRMFGMPHRSYMQLLVEWKRDHNFQIWYSRTDRLHEAPTELLVLGSLRALKNAKNQRLENMNEVNEDKFLDIYPSTRITPDVHLSFFHYFLSYGSTILRTKYVLYCNLSVKNAETFEYVQCLAKSGLLGILDVKAKKRIKDVQKSIL